MPLETKSESPDDDDMLDEDGQDDDLPDLETSFHGDVQEANEDDGEIKGKEHMLTENQRKNLIICPNNPPSFRSKRQLRRATLIGQLAINLSNSIAMNFKIRLKIFLSPASIRVQHK